MAETDKQRLRELDLRIDRLETCVVVLLSSAVAVLLALGSLRHFTTEDGDPVSMMSLLFDAGKIDSSEERIAAIGFIGLLACTALAVVHCLMTWSRGGGAKALAAGRVLFWLMLLGSVVPLLLTLEATSEENSHDAGPAMLYFYAGLGLYAVLLFSEVRNLWVRERLSIR